MPRHTIDNFSGGLVTFQSNKDLQENQYQTFDDVDNTKLGMVQKPNENTSKTAADTAENETISGRGFFSYRTQYDATPSQTSTQWYLYGSVYSNSRIRRYDSSDGVSGSWSNVITSSAWASTSHNPSYLAHNDVLRISDANFNTANTTKWYGHIKRDIFGEGVTYTSSERFLQPPAASAENAWNLVSTDLKPPSIIQMTTPFDGGGDVDSANEVGLFIHYPTDGTGDYEVMSDLSSDTFFSLDKYAVTFEYDYNQESVLSKNSEGTIGILADNWTTGYKKTPPVINLVLNTTSFNKRITGINIYWKPSEVGTAQNVDWYHVIYLDINNAWSKDYRSTDISAYTNGSLSAKNMGYWIPCPDMDNVRGSVPFANKITGGDKDTWLVLVKITIATTDYEVGDIVWAGISSSSTPGTNLQKTDTLIGLIDSVSSGIFTIELSPTPITYRDETDSTPITDTAGAGTRYVYAAPKASNKVATWYIPNDGVYGYTYNSLTGRAAEQEIESHRWQTSTIIGNRAYYGNVKSKDENDQDVEYDSRVYYTSVGKLDEIYAYRYIDVGRNDGDKIHSLQAWGNRLFIIKSRNIYVYNVGSNRIFEEKRFKGVGCDSRYAVTQTPYGIIACDSKSVSLITPSQVLELSYSIRKTWQGLTLDRPSVAYDSINNKIVVVVDSDATPSSKFYTYDFDTKSWSIMNHKGTNVTTEKLSNMIMGDNLYPLFIQDYEKEGCQHIKVVELGSSSTLSSEKSIIKTKRFDFTLPDLKKRFHHIYLTYKSSGDVVVKLFIDGNTTESGVKYQSLTFSSQSTKDCSGKAIRIIGKTLEIQVECVSTDFELDDINIDFEIIGRNP